MLPFEEPLIEDRIKYLTVENYYQAHKFSGMKRSFVAHLNPYEAKKYAKTAPWDVSPQCFDKLAIMERALRFKFSKGTVWYENLLGTCDEEIVEWNDWGDRYWGKDVDTKEGENNLGKLLMKLRDEYNEPLKIEAESKIKAVEDKFKENGLRIVDYLPAFLTPHEFRLKIIKDGSRRKLNSYEMAIKTSELMEEILKVQLSIPKEG